MNCECCEWGIVIDGCKELMANFQNVDFLLKGSAAVKFINQVMLFKYCMILKLIISSLNA